MENDRTDTNSGSGWFSPVLQLFFLLSFAEFSMLPVQQFFTGFAAKNNEYRLGSLTIKHTSYLTKSQLDDHNSVPSLITVFDIINLILPHRIFIRDNMCVPVPVEHYELKMSSISEMDTNKMLWCSRIFGQVWFSVYKVFGLVLGLYISIYLYLLPQTKVMQDHNLNF